MMLVITEGEVQSVFVSYRRDDSAGYAGRLAEHLSSVFGPDHIFMDVQDIAPGQDFATAIENTISACQAVVVVIGPRWAADLKTRGGQDDFVLHEVATALRRNVTVIPVLVGGAAIPSAAELPAPIAALSRRQALDIRDTRFDDDAKLLARALCNAPGFSSSRPKRWAWILAMAALLILAVTAIFWKRGPRFDVNGVWIAEMQKSNQPPFAIRLDITESAGQLSGMVLYPTGDAAIQAGKLERGRLSFFTTHIPQFASEPATVRWTGAVEGDKIRFTATNDGGLSTGIAHRGVVAR